MKWLQIVLPVALAGQLAICRAAERDTAQPKATPPVLRSSEPSDNVVLTLPGAPMPPKRVAAPASVPATAKAPARASVPAPAAPIPEKPPALPVFGFLGNVAPTAAPQPEPALVQPAQPAVPREPPKSPVEPKTHAVATTPKPALPPDFTKDTALFCQKQIGRWKPADARSLMGEPLRRRPAYGEDKKTVNGRIYAFSDPAGRYKELELDFDKSTGNLRTVFSYPPRMTWKECLRLWGNKVAAADARQGRTFYSYLDRRLDVLVDQEGNVISLGLY